MNSNVNKHHSTLQLTWPLGQTPLLALLILGLFVVGSERLLRSQFFQDQLVAVVGAESEINPDIFLGPAVRVNNPDIAFQMERLDSLKERVGSIECIFLGASHAHFGINPEIFVRSFQAETGQTIHCFNFSGMSWSGPTGMVLARALTNRYQPELLIVTTDTFITDEKGQQAYAEALAADPWLRSQLVPDSIQHQLVENSYIYRYYLLSRSLRSPDLKSETRPWLERNVTPYGYYLTHQQTSIINELPTRNEVDYYMYYYRADFAPQSFTQMNDLQEQLTVLLLEIPVHPTFLRYFKGREQAYQEFISSISGRARQYGVPFWRTMPFERIPDEGWAGRGHMNNIGAQVFSAWLGEEVGRAVTEKQLEIPSPPDRTEQP